MKSAESMHRISRTASVISTDLTPSKLEKMEQSLTRNRSLDSLNPFKGNNSRHDLEWDKEADFTQVAESDTDSVYDVNARMAEILAQRFLEFEMNMSISSFSYKKNNNKNNNDREKQVGDVQEWQQEIGNNNDLGSVEKATPASSTLQRALSKRKPPNLMFYKRTNTNFSNVSSISDVRTADVTPVDCFTLEDMIRMKLANNSSLNNCNVESYNNFMENDFEVGKRVSCFYSATNYAPFTFDIESTYSNIQVKDKKLIDYLISSNYKTFHRSMPDLRQLVPFKESSFEEEKSCSCIRLKSKHLSLLDINSFELMYIKSEDPKPENKPSETVQESGETALTSSLSSTNTESCEVNSQRSRLSSVKFSRVSRLEMFRDYMSKLGERIKQILIEAFNNDNGREQDKHRSNLKFSKLKELYSIDEEDGDAGYEIIENENKVAADGEISSGLSSRIVRF